MGERPTTASPRLNPVRSKCASTARRKP
jgi:hypothetical protein